MQSMTRFEALRSGYIVKESSKKYHSPDVEKKVPANKQGDLDEIVDPCKSCFGLSEPITGSLTFSSEPQQDMSITYDAVMQVLAAQSQDKWLN